MTGPLTRVVLAFCCAASLSACATLPPNAPRSPADPLERWNRGVYRFNDAVDRGVVRPVARGYRTAVPAPVRTGISNFLANLETPTVMVNDLLQGKPRAALNDLGRLVMNTTLGLGGLFDPATAAGLDHNNEDFGQTLGRWGVKPGPFLELPLLGPSDLRDGPALVADIYTYPPHYMKPWPDYGIWAVRVVDTRTGLLSLDDTLRNAFDPYVFIRDAYLRHRQYLVTDGKVSDDEPLVDPDAN